MSELIKHLSHFFLFSMALGTYGFSPIANTKLTGVGFFRLVLSIAIASVVLGAGVQFFLPQSLGTPVGIYYGVALVLLLVQSALHRDQKSAFMWVAFAFTVVTLTGLSWTLYGSSGVAYLHLLSSVLLLGVTNYAMVLGHYYLVVPRLSERPLLVCLRILWAICFVKLVMSSYGTWQASQYWEEGTAIGDGYIFNVLLLSMRYLWGYVALLVLSYFAWRLCRMRSIQSATGVLYIMVFFVFIGEMMSAYLFFQHGLTI